MVKIVWPEQRLVSDATIILWAQDAWVNHHLENEYDWPVENDLDALGAAVELLEDVGDVTFPEDWRQPNE